MDELELADAEACRKVLSIKEVTEDDPDEEVDAAISSIDDDEWRLGRKCQK
jgi:hypothetical protein